MFQPIREGGGYQSQTLYGRLEHIYTITFPNGCPGLHIFGPKTFVLGCINRCQLKADEPQLARLNIHLYEEGCNNHLDIADITAIQCLVGRVKGGPNSWAIIDQSGALARTVYLGEESFTEQALNSVY